MWKMKLCEHLERKQEIETRSVAKLLFFLLPLFLLWRCFDWLFRSSFGRGRHWRSDTYTLPKGKEGGRRRRGEGVKRPPPATTTHEKRRGRRRRRRRWLGVQSVKGFRRERESGKNVAPLSKKRMLLMLVGLLENLR